MTNKEYIDKVTKTECSRNRVLLFAEGIDVAAECTKESIRKIEETISMLKQFRLL